MINLYEKTHAKSYAQSRFDFNSAGEQMPNSNRITAVFNKCLFVIKGFDFPYASFITLIYRKKVRAKETFLIVFILTSNE